MNGPCQSPIKLLRFQTNQACAADGPLPRVGEYLTHRARLLESLRLREARLVRLRFLSARACRRGGGLIRFRRCPTDEFETGVDGGAVPQNAVVRQAAQSAG